MPQGQVLDFGPTPFERALRGTTAIGAIILDYQGAKLRNEMLKTQIQRVATDEKMAQLSLQREEFRFGQEQALGDLPLRSAQESYMEQVLRNEALAKQPSLLDEQYETLKADRGISQRRQDLAEDALDYEKDFKMQSLGLERRKIGQEQQKIDMAMEEQRTQQTMMRNLVAGSQGLAEVLLKLHKPDWPVDAIKQTARMVQGPELLRTFAGMVEGKAQLDAESEQLGSALIAKQAQDDMTRKSKFLDRVISASGAMAKGETGPLSVLETAIGSGAYGDDDFYTTVLESVKGVQAKGRTLTTDDIIEDLLAAGKDDLAVEVFAKKNRIFLPDPKYAEYSPIAKASLVRRTSEIKESLNQIYPRRGKTSTTKPSGGGLKPITRAQIANFKRQAGGDINKAKRLAREAGFDPENVTQ